MRRKHGYSNPDQLTAAPLVDRAAFHDPAQVIGGLPRERPGKIPLTEGSSRETSQVGNQNLPLASFIESHLAQSP